MAQPVQAPTDAPTSYIDPTFSLLNSTCLDLLLIELVPMAYRITADLAAREEEWTGTSTAKANRLSSHSNDASSTAAGAGVGTTGAGGTVTVDEEESREAVFHRLESLGYRVGLGVVERYVFPHSSKTPSSLRSYYTLFQGSMLTFVPQILPRHTPPNDTARLHKVPLQRSLDVTLPQANRQSQNQPPRHLRADR